MSKEFRPIYLANGSIPSIGSDPEVFLREIETNRFIPAGELFGPIKSIKPGGLSRSIGADNVTVEYNTVPGTCLQLAAADHRKAFLEIKDIVKKIYRKQGQTFDDDRGPVEIEFAPTIELNAKDMVAPLVYEFGCAPSKLCQNGNVFIHRSFANPMIPIRSAGFHIHLGCPTSYRSTSIMKQFGILLQEEHHIDLVQMCDLLVGLPSVLLDRDPRNKIRRNDLGFGLAGEFRSPSHGFEYRTLSPWPLRSAKWIWWAYCATRDAYKLLYHGYKLHTMIDMVDVADAINNHNVEKASKLWLGLKMILSDIVWPNITGSTDHPGGTVYLKPHHVTYMDYILSLGGHLKWPTRITGYDYRNCTARQCVRNSPWTTAFAYSIARSKEYSKWLSKYDLRNNYVDE